MNFKRIVPILLVLCVILCTLNVVSAGLFDFFGSDNSTEEVENETEPMDIDIEAETLPVSSEFTLTYCEPYVSDLYYWSTGEDAYTTDITGEGTVQINISDVNFTDSEDEKYYNEHFKQDLQDAIDNKSEKLKAYVYIDSNDTLIDHFTVNPYYTNPGGTISLDGDILTVTFSSSHNNESYHDNGEFTEGWDDVDEAHFTLDFYLNNETHYYVFSKFNGVNVVCV